MKLPNSYGSVTKLSGKRRRPYIVRKTVGFHIDEKSQKVKQEFAIIGYARTKREGLQMLADYNKNPFDLTKAKITFEEVYEKWSKQKFKTISNSNINAYKASYKCCKNLYETPFKDLRLSNLQGVIDNCGKNYPTLRKLKVLFGQLYEYAMKNDICQKDYAQYVDIIQYKDRNPNKLERNKFTALDELQKILNHQFKNKTCFGLYIHISCLIERLIMKQQITVYNSEDFEEKHQDFIIALKQSMKKVEEFYNVEIPTEEIEYIYSYVEND